MDALLASLAKLLGVFTEPVQVVLLLIAIAEAGAIYILSRFILDGIPKDRERDIADAKAMEGLTAIIKEKMSGK